MSQQRDLFGGAIVFSIPSKCIDVSDLRQVPDTQEVFVYPDSQISVIVEILQRVAPHDDAEAAKFHFDSLAEDNSAVSSFVESVTAMPNDGGDKTPTPVVLKGNQLVRKFNSTVPDTIHILLAVFRVVSRSRRGLNSGIDPIFAPVDLVLSMNIPLRTAEGKATDAEYEEAQHDFETAVKSLSIINFGLFV